MSLDAKFSYVSSLFTKASYFSDVIYLNNDCDDDDNVQKPEINNYGKKKL